jgi:hypothetical protein
MTKKQDPDQLVSGTDPRIRIHTKMSQIHKLVLRRIESLIRIESGSRLVFWDH